MKSCVALLALAGALGAAHPAQGFGGPRVYRMAGPAVPVVTYTPWVVPVVYGPWPACVAPIVYTYECYPWMWPAPVVVATPAAPAPAKTPSPASATPAQPTPTTGEANPPSGPLAVPRAAPSEPDLIKPVETVTPQRPPMVEFQPAREQPEETLPRLDLPMPKRPAAKETPVQTPELDLPKIEPKTPAPANPGTIPEPKLELPLIDKTKAPKAEESNIPPIVLPQLPVNPASGNKSESKYRPAARVALQIDELPVAGSAPRGEQRKVGFYNFTSETIQLQIAGRDVLLPAKSYVTANVPPTFRWLVVDGSDSPARETTIPADSPGMEVLLKSGTGS